MRQRDCLWLVLLSLLVLGTGIGLRDPWPPDEPRFALIGRAMASGETGWLVPRINDHPYAQKPPVFMWLQALSQGSFGLRVGFLVPSLLAALVVLLLVQDLCARLWGRRAAWAGALVLLCIVQFPMQARMAQIDMVLTAFTTLAGYGFLRHLLLGPAPRWWWIAWVAMGLGVITKGVGFLPLLLLPGLFWLRRRWATSDPVRVAPWQWPLGVLAMLAAMGLWGLPMVLASGASGDPELFAYRNEILFGQTAGRYFAPSGHRHWFGYFVVEVIPYLWLPVPLLLPWLLPAWRRRWRERDLATATCLLGVLAIVLFFSCSGGKRSVYVLPATPWLAIALAPVLPELLGRVGVRRLALVVGATIAAVGCLAWPLALAVPPLAEQVERSVLLYDFDPRSPLLLLGLLALMAVLLGRLRRAVPAAVAILLGVWPLIGLWVWPALDPGRSAAPFMADVAEHLPAGGRLAILPIKTKEQFLLHADRPVTTFGYRLPDPDLAVDEAAAWLTSGSECWLLTTARLAGEAPEFQGLERIELGQRHRREWVLLHRSDAAP